MERTKRIQVYVSPEELQMIRVAAAKAGESMSSYVASFVLDALVPTETYYRPLEEAEFFDPIHHLPLDLGPSGIDLPGPIPS